MFPLAILAVLVVGAVAIGGRQAAGKLPVPKTPDPSPPPPPRDDEPHESDIPWRSDAWTWEIYVLEDGRVVDEAGDELHLDDGLVPIEVCPGDTIVLRIAPAAPRELLAFMLPPVSWLQRAVSSPGEGDFAWTVREPKADAWQPAEVGVHDRRQARGGAPARAFGFAVALAESC